MKVLLTCTSIDESERVDPCDSHYPIGLAYIHSYQKLKEMEDYLLDLDYVYSKGKIYAKRNNTDTNLQ